MEESPLTAVPLVVLDTETTGLNPFLGHRVVEVAALRLEEGQVVDQFDELIQPGRPIESAASRVSGITDADVADAPPFAAVADRLRALLDGALVVAHNARFDADFIGMELAIERWQNGRIPDLVDGLMMAGDEPLLPNPWLCTLQLARRHFYFGRNSLGAIARQLGVRMGRAHRALNDVYMTAEILRRMAQQLARRRLSTVGDLLHAQGGPVFTPSWPQIALPPLLRRALAERRALRIRYGGGAVGTSRVITPLYPTQSQGYVYLVAFCHLRQAQRTFRLDRMQVVELA